MYDQASDQNGGWTDFKPFTVIKKVRESEVITSFYLRPADGTEVSHRICQGNILQFVSKFLGEHIY